MSWSVHEGRDLVTLTLFEILRTLWYSVATRSLATSLPLVTRCGYASGREQEAGKVSGRGTEQRVSSLLCVFLEQILCLVNIKRNLLPALSRNWKETLSVYDGTLYLLDRI